MVLVVFWFFCFVAPCVFWFLMCGISFGQSISLGCGVRSVLLFIWSFWFVWCCGSFHFVVRLILWLVWFCVWFGFCCSCVFCSSFGVVERVVLGTHFLEGFCSLFASVVRLLLWFIRFCCLFVFVVLVNLYLFWFYDFLVLWFDWFCGSLDCVVCLVLGFR